MTCVTAAAEEEEEENKLIDRQTGRLKDSAHVNERTFRKKGAKNWRPSGPAASKCKLLS